MVDRVKVARVVGQIVSSAKDPALNGFKLLLLEDIDANDPAGEPTAAPYVAIDLTGAGTGEVVVVAAGSAARQHARSRDVPIDRAVVCITDSIVVGPLVTYSK
jgi:ethanolamine utilization protein EutN